MKKVGTLGGVVLFIPSTILAIFLLTLGAEVVYGLPRSAPGEPVSIPFSICVTFVLGLALLVPWVAAGVFMDKQKLRLALMSWLAAILAVWYFGLGFDNTMFKVYYVGL